MGNFTRWQQEISAKKLVPTWMARKAEGNDFFLLTLMYSKFLGFHFSEPTMKLYVKLPMLVLVIIHG